MSDTTATTAKKPTARTRKPKAPAYSVRVGRTRTTVTTADGAEVGWFKNDPASLALIAAAVAEAKA